MIQQNEENRRFKIRNEIVQQVFFEYKIDLDFLIKLYREIIVLSTGPQDPDISNLIHDRFDEEFFYQLELEVKCFDFEKASKVLEVFYEHGDWIKTHLSQKNKDLALKAFYSVIKICQEIIIDEAECGTPIFKSLLLATHYLHFFEMNSLNLSNYLIEQLDLELIRFCPEKTRYLLQFLEDTSMSADTRSYWYGRVLTSILGHSQNFELADLSKIMTYVYKSNADPEIIRDIQDEIILLFHRNVIVQYWDTLYNFLKIAPDRSSFTRNKGHQFQPGEIHYSLKIPEILELSQL